MITNVEIIFIEKKLMFKFLFCFFNSVKCGFYSGF